MEELEKAKLELLAPAGNFEKLETALYFGADAVYLSGKSYGLRAFADNFDLDGLEKASKYIHERNKKMYVTLNIFAHNRDFSGMKEYIMFLSRIEADAVIVSDPGIVDMVRKYAPDIDIHLSTQANTTNKYSAAFWAEQGIKRIVLARELGIEEIREIRDYIPESVELEAFVHGSMCISYSGRCLLSNYLAGRASNRGECTQSCRWEYALMEKSRGEYLPIEEDDRGSYILNSRDLNMIGHLDKLAGAGIVSFKIEGRVKSPYYVGSVTGAYKKALDIYTKDPESFSAPQELFDDLFKTGHREYTTGFYLGEKQLQCYETSKPENEYDFTARVTGTFSGGAVVEMRNRFKIGDELEVVSPGPQHNSIIKAGRMEDMDGATVEDAFEVQQILKLFTNIKLQAGDMLRKKKQLPAK